MIYLIVVLLLLLLSFQYDIREQRGGREIWIDIVLLSFIMIAGLRWRLGTDTPNYIRMFYYEIPDIYHLTTDDLISTSPFWILLNSFVLTFVGKFYVVQIIQSLFVNYLLYRYLKKHTKYIFTCFFFYFIYMYLNFNMESMKSATSIVICLFANDYLLERKWLKAYMLFFLASCFHLSAILLLVTPLFLFLRFNMLGYAVLFFSYIVGLVIQIQLGDYLFFFSSSDGVLMNQIQYYSSNEESNQQLGDALFIVIRIVSYIVYSIFSFILIRKWSPNKDLLRFEPFLMLALIFLMMQISIQIFYRYVEFYSLYIVLFTSQAYVDIVKRGKKSMSLSLSYCRSLLLYLPFVFCILMSFRNIYPRYYPYSSVIERKVNLSRENRKNWYFEKAGTEANRNLY